MYIPLHDKIYSSIIKE